MGSRIKWVDVIKGLLILTVILGHAIQEPLKVRGIAFEDNFWRNIIYSFHMPAFMAMSGYLAYRPDTVTNNLSTLLKKRFFQLIIPFFIWSIPLFLVYHNVSHIWDYLLYPNKGYWFLWALFFITIIYSCVDWLCNRFHFKQEMGMASVSVGLICIQMFLQNPKFLGYEYIAYYFLFYMMGYYANKYQRFMPQTMWVKCCLFILWLFMACFWTPNGLPFFLQNISFIPQRIMQLGYRMLTPIVFLLWMYSAAPKIDVGDSRIWNTLIEIGQMSLGLYLVHMVFKNLFAKLLFIYLPSLPIWSNVCIEFIVLLLVSYLCVKLIKRSRIFSKWLLGNK